MTSGDDDEVTTVRRLPTGVTAVMAIGGVVIVAILGLLLILDAPPTPASRSATASSSLSTPLATTARPAGVNPTPLPTASTLAIGKWAGRGSEVTPLQLPAGNYVLVWSVDNTLAQPLWQFQIYFQDHIHSYAPHVDFVHQAGQMPGPTSDVVALGDEPVGRYDIDVETCQFCAWQVSLWKQ